MEFFTNLLIVVVVTLATSFALPMESAGPLLISKIATHIPGDPTTSERIPLPPCSVDDEHAHIKSGRPEESARWRNGIYFQFSTAFSSSESALIQNALYDLSQVVSCIPFYLWPSEASPTGDYVFITRGGSGTGCSATVGRTGGRQGMNLEASGCIHRTVVIHEAIHSLGFHHEQVRPDRDDYVNIFLQNVTPGKEHNFDKKPASLTFGVPYDSSSIMHYASNAFSSNGQATILTKAGATIPYNYELTGRDSQKLRAMYNCP